MTLSCPRLAGILILCGSLFSAAWVQAQFPGDHPLIKRTETERKLLTQKIEGELRLALADAARLQSSSKVRAINVLKAAQAKLEDPLIPPDFRQQWTASLAAAMMRVEKGENAVPPAPPVDPVRREIKEADKARVKAMAEERDAIRKTLDKMQALNKAGRTDLAQEEALTIIKKYPDNPVALVLAENTSMSQRIAEAYLLVAQQSQGFLLAMRSIDKSAIAPKDDIEFDPVRWKEITKARMQPKLTAKEQAILRSLETPLTANFKDVPFEEALKSISTAMGQNILVDRQALQAAMIESNTPTSLSAKGLTARTALRKILQDYGLTFIIREQSIQVVTLEQARNSLVTRVYYLGDVVTGNGPFGSAIQWGPFVSMMQQQENVNRIIETIKGSVDPDSWKERGGNGTITFHWPSMSLIVRQTAEVHAMLGRSLGGGR